jgi:hypothetical protein
MTDGKAAIPVDPGELRQLWTAYLDEPSAGWSIGSFGAIGEFTRDADEPAARFDTATRLTVRTARGALALDLAEGVGPRAWETLRQPLDRWAQGVEFCLPGPLAAMGGRHTLTALGPDREALDGRERAMALFDIGAAAPNVDACIRTGDPELLALLGAALGQDIVQTHHPVMAAIIAKSPTRVFASRLGRVEIYQPIGVDHTPDGPHSHVLPKLLKSGRSHSANLPVPESWMPALSLYPENPVGEGRQFNRAAHDRFQALLHRFGAPGAASAKADLAARVRRGEAPSRSWIAADRVLHTAQRVALRQLRHLAGESPALALWRASLEPAERRGGEAHDSHPH